MKRPSRFLVWSITLCGLGAMLAAHAETQNPSQQQRPTFRTGANFVRVDAYPSKNGVPVLDLKAEDFEVQEDGVPQKIETFEHVMVRSVGAQSELADPSSQRESSQAAADPRRRVFVIFLDTKNVSVEAAHAINEPLIRLINRILAPDDLLGVMTTEMAATQVVLGRKSEVIEESLRRNWAWGRRNSFELDEREKGYDLCYPPGPDEGAISKQARQMITLKREREALDALQDLVRYLQSIREERKAILTVTEGWLLYANRKEVADKDPKGRIVGLDPVTVDPNGKLTTKDPRRLEGVTMSKGDCDGDSLLLATMDNWRYFRDIIEEANHANASFYPIDPRGLPATDNPIYADVPPAIDQAMLRLRLDRMRILAGNTDGLAILDNNDLDKGLRRISDDLSSYYLLGYYSTDQKRDGRYHTLKVRVKRPGVDVRARPGYRAPTDVEVAAARTAADAPVPDATRAVQRALDQLGRVRSGAALSTVAVNGSNGRLWVAGALKSVNGRPADVATGATATIDVTTASGVASTRSVLRPGDRTFITSLALPANTTGTASVRTRLASEESSTPLSETIQVEIGPALLQPLLFRRGPTTGNRLLPAADYTFSRTERMHLEIPVGPGMKVEGGRLLDRNAQPLQVPLTVAERTDDASGQRWLTGDLILSPLADGDYVVEMTVTGGAATQKVLTAIRIVR
jgi:VWFA-related protein